MRRSLSLPLALILLAIVPALDAPAQEGAAAAPDPGLEAMGKLAPLVGKWEGTGWMRMGPGEPSHTRSTETVEFRLDGRILVIEGLHWSKEKPDEVVHHAMGIISHDPETGHYRFRSYLSDGRNGDHEMRLEGDAILWFIDTPRGKIRYTIRIHDGKWDETGEFSADGETWNEFFGMNLKAVG
jgi:hypothetical protein